MKQFKQETQNGHITYHYKGATEQFSQPTSPNTPQMPRNPVPSTHNKSFFQFTTNTFPKSFKTYEKAKLPFAMFFQPFASVLNVFYYFILFFLRFRDF